VADQSGKGQEVIHVLDGAAQERDKYRDIWSMSEYRDADSPGLENVQRFVEVLQPKPGSTIIDIGCGTGVAGLEFVRLGMQSWWLDITATPLHSDVPRERFIEAPLWNDWVRRNRWSYGFCCDVLEHIPTEYTMLCLQRIIEACDVAWLQIANKTDAFGPLLIGEPLHLTVRPYSWWLIRLATLGHVIDARDLCGQSLFVVKAHEPTK
jgi:hypothetical protein